MIFSVPEMSCGHCTAAIEQALSEIDSDATVTCDLEKRRVTVSGNMSQESVLAAMKSAGYEAQAI
ncbi:MAG: heavy-metal-associated domain-containing protein [Paracoccaceae bacterium]|nr:heavy-metal-associated domain-containing protein [Paracoccaceae bacterium]MDG1737644.1 heavy-metal-associated domain-containing protein [Paracoccaceae bacterium]MDG2257677.1 heavy-metal-associated domain-containing protein [Paracoccaceae bacterium]